MGGWGGLQPPPPTFLELKRFGQQDKFGQSFLKKFPYFFEEIVFFLFYPKLAKFDEFLVISEGGQPLIYIFPHVLLLETALH